MNSIANALIRSLFKFYTKSYFAMLSIFGVTLEGFNSNSPGFQPGVKGSINSVPQENSFDVHIIGHTDAWPDRSELPRPTKKFKRDKVGLISYRQPI